MDAGDNTGLATEGEEVPLLGQMPERHATAPELRERDDIWLAGSLV